MIYILIFLLLIVLSFHFDLKGKTKNKKFWYLFLLAIFILMSGIRYRVGVDTTQETYSFYHSTLTLDKTIKELSIFQYPLWKLLNSIIFTIGGKWFWVQMIQSAFVNILLFRYFRKHCQYVFTCLFFYYIWLYASINFEAMKASFAIVLSLYSYDYILEKKYIKGIVLLVIGCLFHISAIIVVPLAFMTFLRINLFGVFLLMCSIIFGYYISKRFDDYLIFLGFDDFISDRAEVYAESDMFFSQGDKNINFYIVNVIPLFLYPLVTFCYVKKKCKTFEMLRLEPYLLIGLFMVGVYASIVIFYRFVDFYKAIFVLFVSQSFVDIIKSSSKFSIGVAGIRAFMLFSLLFLHIFWGYRDRIDKFYPYSSIIERKIYKSKEQKFNENRVVPNPHHNEY